MDTLKKELKLYTPIILLDRYVSYRLRKAVTWLLFILVLLLGAILGAILAYSVRGVATGLEILLVDASVLLGLFFIALGLLLTMLLLSLFYNAFYFRGIDVVVRKGETARGKITFEVANILLHTKEDVTRGLFASPYGQEILKRCGVPFDDLVAFIQTKESVLPIEHLSLPENTFMTIEHVSECVFKKDDALREFLLKHGVREELYYGAVAWTMRIFHEIKHAERWWSRDNLEDVTGIGSDWSYGVAYILERHLRDIGTSTVFSGIGEGMSYASERVEQIEAILSRSRNANVLLVGDHGVGKLDLLVRLAQKIKTGNTNSVLLHRRIVVFDTEGFIATHSSKQEFEFDFMKMFAQAERAGNLVMVIENLTSFIASAESLGVDVGELMDRFLASPELHLIATSDPLSHHEQLEGRLGIMRHFETVRIESPDLSTTVRALEPVALEQEVLHRVTFTYPSVAAIAASADQYITEGVMPEKAVSLLIEIAAVAAQQKHEIVTREVVDHYVSQKTGIPVGPIKEEEREELLNLEDKLHERVIGQNSAIAAISSAMRRRRAGIRDQSRPMGTFLFLGSTGVGKTETAKALAEIFFKDEERMLRLDMSEYSGPDAVARLIGSGSQSGVLANILREQPYGVLLLDEFEKTTSEVHNLFLQILDEGVFSDARGGEVSARNSIIIATSNAGSDMIWDLVSNGGKLEEHKDEIIDVIIKERIYRPELINRFDGVVIFEPLSVDQQRDIARLMLRSLEERIEKKGYKLVVNDTLVDALVEKGYSEQFGARPMRRALQDVIEEKVAEKIIAGGLALGDEITFSKEELSD